MSLVKRSEQPQRKSISRAFRGSLVPLNNNVAPLDILEGQLAGLAEAFTGLQKKFENLQEVHETFLTFNHSFSAFLYGMKMNAHCVEFTEVLYCVFRICLRAFAYITIQSLFLYRLCS
jgi:hypothetical protein